MGRTQAKALRILVAGANRPLGVQIAQVCLAQGHSVTATRRTPSQWDEPLRAAGADVTTLDLADLAAVADVAAQIDRAVLTPILTISGPAAATLQAHNVQRGVVFSSNNVAVIGPDPVYDRLRTAERDLSETAPDWACLRPTMIYGYPGDGNLSRLMVWMRRLPILPALGRGQALQQPIHVRDLAQLAAGLVCGVWEARGPLAVGGPDILPHREMITAVRKAIGGFGMTMPIPLTPAKWVAGSLEALRLPSPLSVAQLDRVDLDKIAVAPADIPVGLRPETRLSDGLAALARALTATRRDR